MAWKESCFVLTIAIALCGITSSGLLAQAAAMEHPESGNRNIDSADAIGGEFGSIDPDAEPAGTGKDDLDGEDAGKHISDTTDLENKVPTASPSYSEPPPPDTVNPPRKIIFDYSTDINFDLFDTDIAEDGGTDIEVGSKEDEEASRWLVVTPSGYEYDGSPEILKEIFIDANFSSSGSLGGDISAIHPGYDVRSKRRVFGYDTRVRVDNFRFPWSVMGRIDKGCTGTFIGPRHVLTAGHCVYNYEKGKWFNELTFRRAKDCDPDRGTTYEWTMALSATGWVDRGLSGYDYGLIVVNRVSYSYMSFGWSSNLLSQTVNVAGYPGDKRGRCMWRSSCRISRTWFNELFYQCDTYHGMSGSGVYTYSSRTGRRVIYCVHASADLKSNSCTRITRSKFELLKRWIRDY